MTPEQVKEIVRITIDELGCRNMLSDPYSDILRQTEKKIYQFFNSKGNSNGIGNVLKELSDDAYIDIIYLQYRDGKTIEWIAEILEKDVSTILRNKKRIIKIIYERLNKE